MNRSSAPHTQNQSYPAAGRGESALLNVPNLITAVRILLIPVFVILFMTPSSTRSLWAAMIFVLASATDLLDGYVARKMEQITRLGKLLDPIADKLLVISAVILLVGLHRVPAILAILLIGREMAITGLRVIASDQGLVIPVERLGKLKTFLQVVSITMLILQPSVLPRMGTTDLHDWGRILLWCALILSLTSAGQYFYRFAKQLRQQRK